MKTRFLAISLFTFFPLLAQGASYDCAKATTYVEKLICSDETVSKLDEQMANAYKQALYKAVDKDDLKYQQRLWLGYRRDNCKDTDCLILNYKERINWLNETAAMEIPKNTVNGEYIWIKNALNSIADPIKKPDDKNVCQDFLKNLNSFRAPTPMICETKLNSEIRELHEIKWRNLDVPNNRELIFEIERYLIKRSAGDEKIISDEKVKEKIISDYKSQSYLDYTIIDIEKNGKPGTMFRLNKLRTLGCTNSAHLNQESIYFYANFDVSKEPYPSEKSSMIPLFGGHNGELFLYKNNIYLLQVDASQPINSALKKTTDYRFSQLRINIEPDTYMGDEVCQYKFVWPVN